MGTEIGVTMNLKLKEMRSSLGMSQREFAKAIGKSYRTIQMWEGGESFPNAEAIWQMCEFFDTDPNTFMGWYDTHPREDASLSQVESVLIQDFRQCSPERKRKAADAVRDQRSLSEKQEEDGVWYEEVVL